MPGMTGAEQQKPLWLDMHTHILPGMDDGSASVEMSVQMLRRSLSQGTCGIVLTSHFYAHQDTLDHFLEKRRRALLQLRGQWRERYPILLAGAEVYYFRDMASVPELLQLRIQNTELLMLEMPFKRWTDSMLDDILRLHQTSGVQVVLAHLDRYLADQPKGLVEELVGQGVLVQINADSVLEKSAKQKVLKLFESGMVHFLGSDCHNMTSRPPRIGDAAAVLREAFGDQWMTAFANAGMRRLIGAKHREIVE